MPITYAGVPLTPTTAATEAAGRYWHLHRLDPFEYQGYLVPGIAHLPTPYLPKQEPPRIGVLSWPVQADRFATCWLAVTDAELVQVRVAIGSSPTAKPLVFTDGTAGGTVTAQMYLAGTLPISQRGDSHEFYLLLFVDRRYFWWQTGGTAFNGPYASWSNLLNDLFTAVGVAASLPSIPSAYLTPNPNRWQVGVQPAPPLIQAACTTVGVRPVTYLDGAVAVQTYTTAALADDSRWSEFQYECLAGGRVVGSDIARGLPASVDTVFFDPAVVNTTLASLSLPLAGGQAGTAAGVGRVTADPDSTTPSERTAYATQAAQDYYNWAFSRTDATFRGILPLTPNGLDETLEWVHTEAAMATRVLRAMWSDRNIYGARLNTTTTTASPTTTTTTTTTLSPCPGECQWTYLDTTKEWTLDSSSCSMGCACLAPTFCPSGDACTATPCGTLPADQPPPNCTGTTTTPAPGGPCDTTTTISPSCTQGCRFYCHPLYGWVNIRNGCAPTCPCPDPPGSGCTPCDFADIDCAVPPPPPGPTCYGYCQWIWVSDQPGQPDAWLNTVYACVNRQLPSCTCQAPVTPTNPYCGLIMQTQCYTPGDPTPNPCETPTTPSPGTSCTDSTCIWGTSDGARWDSIVRPCPSESCGCGPPGSPPTGGVCAQAVGVCAPTTTTTAAPTTTTTTTPSPAFFCWDCFAGERYCTQFSPFPGDCTQAGGPYPYSTCVSSCLTTTTAAPTTTTTTALATTSTTTPAPGEFYCWDCPGGLTCSQTNPGGCTVISGPYASGLLCLSACN